MSQDNLASRDEVERFKPYIEIAKYAISVSIALAAVCGFLLRFSANAGSLPWISVLAFALGILFNVVLFLVCHRLVSEATAAITHEMNQLDRNNRLKEINNGPYSFFVICFVGNLIYWSIAILVIALS